MLCYIQNIQCMCWNIHILTFIFQRIQQPSFWHKNSMTLGNWVYNDLKSLFFYIICFCQELPDTLEIELFTACMWFAVCLTGLSVSPKSCDKLRYTGQIHWVRYTETCETNQAEIHWDLYKQTQLASAALLQSSVSQELVCSPKILQCMRASGTVYGAFSYWWMRPAATAYPKNLFATRKRLYSIYPDRVSGTVLLQV